MKELSLACISSPELPNNSLAKNSSVHPLENCISYLQCPLSLSASSIHPLTDTHYSLTIISVCISASRLNLCNRSLAHSFIHSDHFYSTSSSLFRSAPNTALILCRSFTP